MRFTATNCYCAAASTMFCHAYVLTYIFGVICLVLIKGDFTDPLFITNLIEIPLFIFSFYFGFYVLQERELRRFNQEQRALKKEAQLTRVFNSISDAILVVQEMQGKNDNLADSDEEIIEDPKCLFVNSKSLEILGNDLIDTIKKSNGHSVAPTCVSLNLRQFELTPSPFHLIKSESTDTERRLISLKDIINRYSHETIDSTRIESYKMHSGSNPSLDHDRYLVVKRTSLSFNKKNCQVLSISDLTSFQQLKEKEESNRFLIALNTTVHHEMIAPLKANTESS